MALLQIVLFLLLYSVALGWLARHFRFPYPIALVIGGGALGFVPRLPQLPFEPQSILVLVLVLQPFSTRRRCSLPGATSRPPSVP